MTIGPDFDSVLAAARGDRAWAYERLWAEYAPRVGAYLRLQGAVDHEDLTSEVFMAVFGGIGDFAGSEAGFRAWVFCIARSRLIDSHRRSRARPNCVAADPWAWDRVGGDVEDDALRRMSEGRVRALCDGLTPSQRDVLLLRVVADLTVEEVAATLGRTPGAVKALQRRGLCQLRALMVDHNDGVPL